MSAEIRKWSNQFNIALNIGLGGIFLGSYLIALLSRFPSQGVEQPFWTLVLLETAAAFALAIFGFVQVQRTKSRLKASIGDNSNTDDAGFVKYQRNQERGLVYIFLVMSVFAPINWPFGKWPDWVSAGGFLFIVALFLLTMNSMNSSKEAERQYEQTLTPELIKESTQAAGKNLIPLLISFIFFAAFQIASLFAKEKIGDNWTFKPEMSSILVLVALLLLIAEFMYLWRIKHETRITA